MHVDPNLTNLNRPIPANSTNIGSIHDSKNIRAIEKILSLPIHLVHTPPPVPDPPLFTYGRASDPNSLLHESSA